MVVAVTVVRVVQVTIDKIVDMVAVGNGRMTTVRAMYVIVGMSATTMLRRAIGRVRCVHVERVLLDTGCGRVVQVSIVEVVDMIAVFDGLVSAVRAVLMIVLVVVISQGQSPSLPPSSWA